MATHFLKGNIFRIAFVCLLFTVLSALSSCSNNNPSSPAPVTIYVVPITPTFTPTAVPPHYLTQWGSTGGLNGQFQVPWGVALNNAGTTVYVTDVYNNRVEAFSPAGAYLTQWGSAGTSLGQFSYPNGVAVDSNGFVYVADSGNNRIEKFTSAGVTVLGWGSAGNLNGQFGSPAGVEYDVYFHEIMVTDYQNNRYQGFSTIGGWIFTDGFLGSGDGRFDGPIGIASDTTGKQYIADRLNNRVQRLGAGAFETQWGVFGAGNSQFNQPFGVALDNSSSCNGETGPCVFVVDQSNYRVQKFTSNGTYLNQWGSYGSANGQFINPCGIAVDASGNIYVVDSGNNRIQVFAP